MDDTFNIATDAEELAQCYLKIAYTLDPIQLLVSYSYFFTNISLEELADRVYRKDPKTGRDCRVSKQSIHQYIIRPIYENIQQEMEDLRMQNKIRKIKRKGYKNKYLIAVDGATEITGYTVFKNDEIIDNGIIRAKASLPTPDRIAAMQRSVGNIISRYKEGLFETSIFFMAMEDFYFNPRKKASAKAVLGLRGAFYSLINTYPQLVFLPEVNQSSWKAMFGKANEPKDTIDKLVIKYLVKEKGIDEDYLSTVPVDAIESAAIGLYTIKHMDYYKEVKIIK